MRERACNYTRAIFAVVSCASLLVEVGTVGILGLKLWVWKRPLTLGSTRNEALGTALHARRVEVNRVQGKATAQYGGGMVSTSNKSRNLYPVIQVESD